MRKNYVQKEDYDFYSIKLPLKIAFSGKRKSFILRELEKIHPKVSSSCFVRSWLHLKKGKLQADVAVMEKSLLARYKKQFPGSVLYLPEKKREPISGGKKKISIFLSLALLLIAGFFSAKIVLDIFAQQKKVNEKKPVLISNENDSAQKSVLPVLLAPSKLVAEVFSQVSKKGGRISFFSYDRGICTFSVNGCSSEDVAQAQYCVVSYKGNNPQFTLSVPVLENENFEMKNQTEMNQKKFNERLKNQLKNAKNGRDLLVAMHEMRAAGIVEKLKIPEKTDYQSSIKNVRNELFKFGAAIQKEHVTEKISEFEFTVPEEFFYSALKICGTEAKKLGWNEKSFSVEKNGSQNHVEVAFSRENEGENIDSDFSPMLLTASYAWLFKSENLEIVPKQKKFVRLPSNQAAEIQKIPASENRVKIGEIRKNDGFTYVYYRKNDGKISFERKES